MRLSELLERLKQFDPDCLVSLRLADDTAELEELKVEFLGGTGPRRHLVLIGDPRS